MMVFLGYLILFLGTFSHENGVLRYRFHFSGMSHILRLVDVFWELRQGIAVVGGGDIAPTPMWPTFTIPNRP